MKKKLFSNSPTDELNAWEKHGEETKLAGKFGVSVISRNFVNPITQQVEEYAFCRKVPGMTVLPILESGNLVITRQFKQGSNQIVWEFPAGKKPKDVSAEDQARAELKEESGLIVGKMISLGRACAPGPRKYDTYEDLFLATGCIVGDPRPEPGEILEVYEMTPEELWEIVMSYDGSFSGFSEMVFMRACREGYIKL